MKKITSAVAVFAMSVSMAAFGQQPAPMTSGPAQIFTTLPVGTTVTNFYKQNVYDPSDNKIGDIDDMLIDKEGRVTALIIGVGGFLGMGEKNVAIPFSDVRASEKNNNKWYLVLNTTKDALKTAPGYTYDKTKTTWLPAAK
jgi:sporulation protein YlmC with PRC-barrel domain